jgi:hypothetical protein
MEVEALLEPVLVDGAGMLDVDPPQPRGLDGLDARLLGPLCSEVRSGGSAQPPADPRLREARHGDSEAPRAARKKVYLLPWSANASRGVEGLAR